jgi:hypothetical protein
MQILTAPNSPYGDYSDRSFKTVPAAMRFMLRSYFDKGSIARHVEIYNMTAPVIHIDFTPDRKVVLSKGTIEGWEVGKVLDLDAAIALTRKYHRED